jgi:hypothetical protein
MTLSHSLPQARTVSAVTSPVGTGFESDMEPDSPAPSRQQAPARLKAISSAGSKLKRKDHLGRQAKSPQDAVDFDCECIETRTLTSSSGGSSPDDAGPSVNPKQPRKAEDRWIGERRTCCCICRAAADFQLLRRQMSWLQVELAVWTDKMLYLRHRNPLPGQSRLHRNRSTVAASPVSPRRQPLPKIMTPICLSRTSRDMRLLSYISDMRFR